MKQKKELVPIVLIVYNRLEHTKKVIESLKKNTLSKKSVLYIFSDYQKNENDKEGVRQVRDYLKTVEGFKKIKVIEMKINKGLSKNIIDAVTKIINEYGKVIVLEDDVVVSKYFLKYMNDSLDIYKDNKKVGAILGFIFPLEGAHSETFFLNYFASWGWATWKDRWDLFERDGLFLYDQLKEKGLRKKFNINGTYPFTRILRNQIKGNNDSWAIRFYASLMIHNKFVLYPKKSLVQNIGFDGTGVHCGKRDVLKTKVYQDKIYVRHHSVYQSSFAYSALQEYYKKQRYERIQNKIKRFIKNPFKELNNL